ncbi:glutamyl-tRNA(Gln) amidotransferase subunit C, mitochondrial [Cataglyphis hispanica]|uniref:glutamyl-tRNA(Gln) amidotransferase subunit C, mitochondrial n=1 Tax=Cataglyphis hispanica TaxID=1086592 RepID=UPI00217FC69B|nr:glutamyl-tRNA(Gln) amidotransferase subunit C, mitochondrial [Cataglyphis hispanica]
MYAVRRACKLFDKNVIIPLHPITSSKTYRSSMVQAKQQQAVENINNQSRGDKKPVIDEAIIRRLERLALVGFEYEQSKRILEEAIAFAERLRTARIDETVRPMYSTLENDRILLRDDVARNGVDRCEILRNAAVLEEEYFVAPLMTTRSDSER